MYVQNRSDWLNKPYELHAIGRYSANKIVANITTRYYYHKQH